MQRGAFFFGEKEAVREKADREIPAGSNPLCGDFRRPKEIHLAHWIMPVALMIAMVGAVISRKIFQKYQVEKSRIMIGKYG